MDMDGGGGDGGQEALEDAQLNALIRNVVASAEKLHSLGLQAPALVMALSPWNLPGSIAGS